MRLKMKRKWALLMVLVTIGTLMCGSMAMAEEHEGGHTEFEKLKVGDVFKWSFIVPEDYAVYVNDEVAKVQNHYTEGHFCVNNGSSGIDPDWGDIAEFKIDSLEKDDESKEIRINGAFVSKVYFNGVSEWYEIGQTVTLKIPDGFDQNDFVRWEVYETKHKTDISAEVGLTEQDLQNPEITFTVPARRYVGTNLLKKGDDPIINTISGNVPNQEEEQSCTSSTGGSSSNSEAVSEVPKNQVMASNGSVLKSTAPLYSSATDIKGVAVTTPKENVNTAAGLTQDDVNNGTNTKFYVGNVYKKDVKDSLKLAVDQMGGTLVSMLDIDLYTISKKGTVSNISTLSGEDQTGVDIVIGLPGHAVKDGRSFSLVYMDANGTAVEIKDADNDAATMTVNLKRFGAFAVIYR